MSCYSHFGYHARSASSSVRLSGFVRHLISERGIIVIIDSVATAFVATAYVATAFVATITGSSSNVGVMG